MEKYTFTNNEMIVMLILISAGTVIFLIAGINVIV